MELPKLGDGRDLNDDGIVYFYDFRIIKGVRWISWYSFSFFGSKAVVVMVVYWISICDVNHAVIGGMRGFLRFLMGGCPPD